ncbi:MAG: MBL fold metallo-hydrolase [Spirochaetaceae bacterium]
MKLNNKVVLFILLSIVVMGCSTPHKRSNYSAESPKVDNWDEIFSRPKDITVETWNTGQLEVVIKGIINLKHKDAPKYESKKMFVDVPVYLIKSKDNGTFLVDSGLDKSYEKNKYTNVKGLLKPLFTPDGQNATNKSIYKRLSDNNIKLDGMFFTHLHFDHSAGLSDLEPTFPIVVGKSEDDIDLPPLYRTTHLDKVTEIKELDFEQGKALYPFSSVLDVFGDGSIYAINTNGHSTGHVSYLINSTNGPYLMTGDQVNFIDNITSGVGPGMYSRDVEKAQEYFDQIMEFKSIYPEVELLFGHYIKNN